MKRLIQVATPFEAVCLIKELHLQRNRLPGLSHFYQNHEGTLFLWISGIGQRKLKRSIETVFNSVQSNPSEIHCLNIGIAASLQPNIPKGTLFHIRSIQHQQLHGDTESPIFDLSKHWGTTSCTCGAPANLLTTESPLTDPDAKLHPPAAAPQTTPTLIDMEGFHWANTLTEDFHVETSALDAFKVVSDHGDGERINFFELASLYDSAIRQIINNFEEF